MLTSLARIFLAGLLAVVSMACMLNIRTERLFCVIAYLPKAAV